VREKRRREIGAFGEARCGGIVIAAPGVTPRWRATVNGRPAPVTARGEVVVRALPARVTLAP